MEKLLRRINQELVHFIGRDDALRRIQRYRIYKVMFYRTNDLVHSRSTTTLAKALMPHLQRAIKTPFDAERVMAMCPVHDDNEIIADDIEFCVKMVMTDEERRAQRQHEEEAIAILVDRFPRRLGPFVYGDLLDEVMRKETLEAKIVSFIDKFDALGEALHEVYAGNMVFVTNIHDEKRGVTYDISPIGTGKHFIDLPTVVPALAPLLNHDRPLWNYNPFQDWKGIALSRKQPDRSTIEFVTGCEPYDLWKNILLTHGGDEERRRLTTVIERP